jgi:hypothetical protein
MRRLALAVLVAGCRSSVPLEPPLAFPCQVDAGQAQCVTGWRCGLDGRCHDTSAGAALVCVTDGDCEQHWRCGLEGVCHARDVAAAYPCHANSDCERDWRCGLDGTCHDRDAGSDYRCHDDSDCELGWQCGLSGLCHDRDGGAPYACTSDHDCTGGWRCGLDAICVDTSVEGLQPRYEGPLKTELLSPLLGVERADQVAVSASPRAFTIAVDGGLTQIMDSADGGSLGFVYTLALDAGALSSLVTLGARSFLLDSAGFAGVDWASHTSWRIHDGGGARRLKLVDGYPLILGIGDHAAWLYDADGGLTVELLDGGQSTLLDLSLLFPPAGYGGGDPWLLAATDDGLSTATLTDAGVSPWTAVEAPSLPNAQCGPAWSDAGTTYRAERIETSNGYLQDSIVLVVKAAGSDQPFLQGRTSLGLTCTDAPVTRAPWPCPVCAPGEQLVDLAINQLWDSTPTFRCQGSTGHSTVSEAALYDNGDRPPSTCPPVGFLSVYDRGRSFSAGQTSLVLASEHGTLARLPVANDNDYLFSWEAGPVVRTDAGLWADGYPYREGIGFVGTSSRLGPGAPSSHDPGELFVEAQTPDGGTWVVTTGDFPRNDTLVAGEDGGTLAFRLSPRPFSQIISIATLPPFARPDGGIPFVAGYALTVDSVFYFEATSSTRWRAQEIVAPPGHYVSVWTDGAAGRLASRDGTVRSLPNLLVLSGPMPNGEDVISYRRLCGQPYALTADALFRLQRSGTWSAQDLSTLIPGFAVEPALARLDLLGDELFVSTLYGAVVRLSPPLSCP